jgi:hypothetical protein
MAKWILLLLASVTCGACMHATPATQTAWHNPSMPNSSGQKLKGVRSRDAQTTGTPGSGVGAGVM